MNVVVQVLHTSYVTLERPRDHQAKKKLNCYENHTGTVPLRCGKMRISSAIRNDKGVKTIQLNRVFIRQLVFLKTTLFV